MVQVKIKEFEESFVIYMGSETSSINAYTLASTLISFADAAKAANDFINPGYNIEIQVVALGDGSFKTEVKAVYEEAKNLFSKESLKILVLGVIAAFVYEHTLAPDMSVKVVVNDESVVIKQGEKEIIVPREVHEYLKEVKKSEKFKEEIGNTFSTIEKDNSITSFGIQKSMSEPKPPIEIPKKDFPRFSGLVNENLEAQERSVEQVETVQILRAILEKGDRLWQFSWKGIRISAPVLDNKFYRRFYNHEIRIAPGDALKIKLKIYQKRNEAAGIYVNTKYEVIEVLDYTSRSEQINLDS